MTSWPCGSSVTVKRQSLLSLAPLCAAGRGARRAGWGTNTMSQMDPLSGRAALVTGVTRRSGIGFAVARRLAQLGADVCVHSWLPGDTVRTDSDEPVEALVD